MKNAVAYMRYKREVIGDFVDADGHYGYQCVDLIRDYCKKAFNFTMGRLPRAKDADQSTFPGWTMYPGSEGINMRKGDIGITGGTEYGHIFIVDKVENDGYIILEQNGKGGGKKIAGNEIRLRMCKRGNPPLLRYFRHA